MNKIDKEALLVLGGGGLLLSFLPVIPEPYYHVDRVNFWEWLIRELQEVLTGERARLSDPLTGNWSFELLLRKYLREKQPSRILEWGPGMSTHIMSEEVPTASIYTIEHSRAWADKWRKEFSPNVEIVEIPLGDNYLYAPLNWEMTYDMIFVDGERSTRNQCLAVALQLLTDDGVVILHDSDWEEYASGKDLFKIVEENRRTAVMERNV